MADAPLRILIVDDEAPSRRRLRDLFDDCAESLPLTVVGEAANGVDALEVLHLITADLVVTDIRMPDMDGRALYQEIERRWPGQGARVVFVTGDTLTTASRDFVAACGRPVIEKPFLPSEVRRVVAELAGEVQRAPDR